MDRSLEALNRLRLAGADFAKREDQIIKDFRARRYALTRKQQEVTGKAEARHAALVADVEARTQRDEERARDFHLRRSARIDRGQASGIQYLQTGARAAKERWLSDLQLKHLNAKKKLPQDMKSAEELFAGYAAELGEQRNVLLGLRRSADKAFDGYGSFKSLLKRDEGRTPEPTRESYGKLAAQLQEELQFASEQLAAFRRLSIPRFFRALPLPVLLMLLVCVGGVAVFMLRSQPVQMGIAGAVSLLVLVGLIVLHRIGYGQSKASAEALAKALDQVRTTYDVCGVAVTGGHAQRQMELQEGYDQIKEEIAKHWEWADDIEEDFARTKREKIQKQVPRLRERNAKLEAPKLLLVQSQRASRMQTVEAESAGRLCQMKELYDAEVAALDAEEEEKWADIVADWERQIVPIYRDIEELNIATSERFPAWNTQVADAWKAPVEFSPAVKFAQLDVDLSTRAEAIPKDKRLALPASPRVSIPLSLAFPEQGSLLFETAESGTDAVIGTLNNIILRLLATTPPGKLSFTILDPVGLGQSFAGLMHLSDYEESLINRRIWTQQDQIEERLAELSEHIEKVIQMYLRNEYATITEYNAQAGSVAEKYHFLVVADFPANFSEGAVKRLQSIAASGARCGIFTLIHWDTRLEMPDGFVPDELRKSSVCIRRDAGQYVIGKEQIAAAAALIFDAPPNAELAVALTHKIGKSSIDSNRVEVPFAQIAPAPEELWTGDTTSELRVAVGRTGATKFQMLAIGKGTRQHALLAGKTGSGKSTLLHVIITNLALSCSPSQVEFYLIDFKKGVEFKCYATRHLPHARVIAIESDREFGLSVLQRVDEELKRRGDMFRKLGVQDIAGYKRAGGTEAIPRSLLIIDEFQEFFVEDDIVAQTASMLFDRLVRQGRAFGIHVILGSQTLGGAYTLARATLGQMVIRIALQCNESDAYLIMDESNPAPRLLSRPGEGIYNDAAGAVEGNSPFQVVWLPDEERDRWLDKVDALAKQHHLPHSTPIVFEGNAPADIRENDLLHRVLATRPTAAPAFARCWLGAPNSIKGPTEAVFRRQSGNHLLVVGQRDESALMVLGVSIIALAAQYPVGGAKFVLLHTSAPGTPDGDFIEHILAAVPHEVTVARGNEIAEVMGAVAAERKARAAGESATAAPIFVLIAGLQKFKKLRQEDDFSFSSSDADENPGSQLTDIITEGSTVGIHLLVTMDTFNNVNRFINRKALSEFEMRIVFQMSANDSASLIDSPKASGLGLHRALYYNEQEGTLETFRPYATPTAEWIAEAGAKLRQS